MAPRPPIAASMRSRGSWEECRAELHERYEELNLAMDGTLHIDSEYLVTIARR
jgi:hypothetical protein